ncbi:hypothetical protein DFH29DRAFT_998635 [Suillus ampliporus]|nr:hypothetical protein DFH29DRAFT_998635 [Suillus ampliporus]
MLNFTRSEEQHLKKIFKEIADSVLDLRRVVNASPIARISTPAQKRQAMFDTTEIGGDRVTVLHQLIASEKGYSMATIVLGGATANHLDDLESAPIDDGVNVIKSLVQDPWLVPGAGTTELELGKAMDAYGDEGASATYREAKGGEAWGVDVEGEEDGTLLAIDCKILCPLAEKQWAIKLATEAAVSVLSVDNIIMSTLAGGPKVPRQASNWDED